MLRLPSISKARFHRKSISFVARELAALIAVVCILAGAPSAAAVQGDDNPRSVYFSVGDNQDLLGLPLDSKTSIDTAFDVLRDSYGIHRIWWRGIQEEIWGKTFVLRPENRFFAEIWQWWRHLAYEDVGTNRLAVQAAHERGLSIWGAYNVTDSGSGADVGFTGFPYAMEDRQRVAHPEYAPVNRWGTWKQGGPVEFAYAGARAGLVESLVQSTVAGKYDGLVLMTYAENFSQRYDDEFGFNEPVAAEFKKRYGVDIRTEPFDHDAWARLRGEYFTQFLRELRAGLSPHHKKLAVCVDGADPHWPTIWSGGGGAGFRSAGMIYFDVATWAAEALVDEVCAWGPRDEGAAAVVRLAGECRGSSVTASALRTRGWLPPGAPRVMFLGEDLESGFDYEHYLNQPDERIELQPEDSLKSPDKYARRRSLTAVLKGKAHSSTEALAAAAADADLYVRRLAVRALGAAGEATGVPALEAALHDQEHSVRCEAFLALGALDGPHCLPALWAVLKREPASYPLRLRAMREVLRKWQTEGKLGPAEKQPIIDRLEESDARIREAALYALQSVGAPATPEVEKSLMHIVEKDASPYAREMAMVNLRSSFGFAPPVLATLRAAEKDPDDAVGARAAAALALLGRNLSAAPELRRQILAETVAFFRRYGEGSTRGDQDWGWRIVGEALLDFGDEGKAALLQLMRDTKDPVLAGIAWRVVYLRQGDRRYPVTLEQDIAAHAARPRPE
jgi:HEAT repeat protein